MAKVIAMKQKFDRSGGRVLPDESLTLELTGAEALFLRDLLEKVGGSPFKSRRQFAGSVLDGLASKLGNNYNTKDLRGTIECV